MQNTFRKYTSGVYCMASACDTLELGDGAEITTRRGKVVPVTVWKRLGVARSDGATLYSVTRDDGFCRKEWMTRKLARQENAATRQERLSDEYSTKSNKDRAFLSLGEPIKIGHHSEKRHRKAIDDAWNNMGKSVEASRKAEKHEDKAATLAARLAREISLDTPESVDLLVERIADLEQTREEIKARPHESYELSNLGANIRRYRKRLETARKLWDLEHVEVPKAKPDPDADTMDKIIADLDVVFAFNDPQFYEAGITAETHCSIGAGGYLPKANKDAFLQRVKAL